MASIYRYYRGDLRKIVSDISIPNAISFAPGGTHAYYADTTQGRIWRQALNHDGWPDGAPRVFLDLGPGSGPDGAVVDAGGRLWNAQWGHYRVAVYDTDAQLVRTHALPARQPSCPAFGGDDLTVLYVTTAREHLGAEARAADGMTYRIPTEARGQAEHRVIL